MLDLAEVYAGLPEQEHMYHLRSMVCYYGQHYFAYVLTPEGRWLMLDDCTVVHVGNWAEVVSRCALGRAQASVLFFEHA